MTLNKTILHFLFEIKIIYLLYIVNSFLVWAFHIIIIRLLFFYEYDILLDCETTYELIHLINGLYFSSNSIYGQETFVCHKGHFTSLILNLNFFFFRISNKYITLRRGALILEFEQVNKGGKRMGPGHWGKPLGTIPNFVSLENAIHKNQGHLF